MFLIYFIIFNIIDNYWEKLEFPELVYKLKVKTLKKVLFTNIRPFQDIKF